MLVRTERLDVAQAGQARDAIVAQGGDVRAVVRAGIRLAQDAVGRKRGDEECGGIEERGDRAAAKVTRRAR